MSSRMTDRYQHDRHTDVTPRKGVGTGDDQPNVCVFLFAQWPGKVISLGSTLQSTPGTSIAILEVRKVFELWPVDFNYGLGVAALRAGARTWKKKPVV